ncbi:MAG: SUMF1/EgtB/PvdO family nonheme iron enzyme [Bacteroidales bacterium]|nr:SUMF1/EgtB/PvdO family nonheme iron enzyme [Bacteroidales bacterium]
MNKTLSRIFPLLCFVLWGAAAWSPDPLLAQGTSRPQAKERTFTVKGVSFVMVTVQGGTFSMGATYEQAGYSYEDEEPVHKVTVGDFAMGKFEVTQALWKAVMGSNPSFYIGDNLPVECVSWHECQEFIRRLNQLTGQQFRLPTEAEWEYAARGGRLSKEYRCAGSDRASEVAWFGGTWDVGTHPVGRKAPNELGLYDMSGNIYEWCQDWFGRYRGGEQTNPKGPENGKNRVLRGGSWFVEESYVRVSNRSGSSPDSQFIHIGFRLAMTLPAKP